MGLDTVLVSTAFHPLDAAREYEIMYLCKYVFNNCDCCYFRLDRLIGAKEQTTR